MTTTQETQHSTELAITGMTCASCVAHVGRALRKVPGVSEAAVNLATERAAVVHAPDVGIDALVAAVERAGYGAQPVRDESTDEDARRRDEEIRRKRRLLIFAVVFFVPTLVLGMTPLQFAGKDWAMLALTLPVWLFVGGEFHRGALAGLRHGTANMDTLVSLGSSAALGYSVYASVAMQPSYYETASAIVTLVFIGKYLEAAARGRSNRAIRALLDLRPQHARVREADGSVRDIPVDDVRAGATLIVAAGERIPVDGLVLEGTSAVDASMLTGEPIPVAVEPGSTVKQGTLNGDGTLVVKAQAVGAGTTLAKIVDLVRRAQGTTPPVQRLADRVAGVFVPAILIIAAITFIVWVAAMHRPWPQALADAIAVLVVACPCALGLATPTAIMVGVGTGAKRGLLFRDADAIERLGAVRVVLFDKTGTLTIGKPEALAIHAQAPAAERDVLAAAAALEQGSTHPLAAAIVTAARERGIAVQHAQDVVAQRGGGLQGRIDGKTFYAGNEAYVRASGVSLDGSAAAQTTRVFVARGTTLLGSIDLGDAARPESAEAVGRLQRGGIEVELVSGDAPAPTQRLAEQLHIAQWHAQISPEGKAGIVQRARERGAAAFVGDGINDAPALASADVGIAMGGGTEIALETAQAAIISNDPRAVAVAIELSRATLRTIKQNLFWAFAYNVVLVPLAAVGIVHPILAAGAMGASSLFVVGNSLLLQRKV